MFGHTTPEDSPYYIYSMLDSIIEDVIGCDDMTNLYFSADLKCLFERLSFYSSKEKTSLFLKNFDSLLLFEFVLESKHFYKTLNPLIDYLTEVSINYVNVQIKKGVFTPEDGRLFLQNYHQKINDIDVYMNKQRDEYFKNKKLEAGLNPYQIETSSFEYVQDNNELGYFQVDDTNYKKRTRGIVSFNLIFGGCIILAMIITFCYLFII